MKGEVENKSRQRRNDCAVQTGSLHHQGINVTKIIILQLFFFIRSSCWHV